MESHVTVQSSFTAGLRKKQEVARVISSSRWFGLHGGKGIGGGEASEGGRAINLRAYSSLAALSRLILSRLVSSLPPSLFLLLGIPSQRQTSGRGSVRGRSESPEGTEMAKARREQDSLGREARSRRAAEAALLERSEEVQRLKSEIVALKVRGASEDQMIRGSKDQKIARLRSNCNDSASSQTGYFRLPPALAIAAVSTTDLSPRVDPGGRKLEAAHPVENKKTKNTTQ